MKKLIFSALISALSLLACPQLPAAQKADTFETAKTLVNDDGYIIFAYADGWDAFNQKRYETLMESKVFQTVTGNAVLIPLPIPDIMNDELRQQQQERLGELKLPYIPSYPALILYDKNGTHYATISRGVMTRGKISQVARELYNCRKKGKERERLLAEAEESSGAAKAALLLKAYQIDGLSGPPHDLAKRIAEIDPQDESGGCQSLRFDPYGFAAGLDKLGVEAGIEEVEKKLNAPGFSNRQKQQFCAAAIGMLRRQGGVKEAARMRHYLELMKKLNPESAQGLAVDFLLDKWIPALRYVEGWTPSGIAMDDTPVELEGSLPINKAGTYTVTFQYKRGGERLIVAAVELYDGKTKVAEDRHTGYAGAEHVDNVYTLTVSKAVREPHLFITMEMSKQDTYGDIIIEKQ